jgi:N-acetylneuraminic acid mutarotase
VRRFLPLAIALSLLAAASASAVSDEAARVAPSGGCWQMRAAMPIDLYAAAGASDGRYAYVAGGYSSSTNQTLDTLFRFDPASNTWMTMAPMPTPAIMASAVYFPPTNEIHVFGGQHGVDGTNYAITRVYDVESDTWSTGANMPDVRTFMASAYDPLDEKILLVGGYRTGEVSSAQSQVWGVRPRVEYVRHESSADPACGRGRCLRLDRPPPLRRRRT